MILRIRRVDGSTVRGSGSAMDTLLSVLLDSGAVVEEEVQGEDGLKAFRDARGVGKELVLTKTLSDLGLDHGEFVYLKGPKKKEPQQNGQLEKEEANVKDTKKKCKFHGPQMVCTSCTGEETREERLQRALRDVWTVGGMSMAVEQALESFRFVVKRQEEGRTKVAVVDNDAAFEFQSYLAKIEFQQQRCGILYGTVDGDKTYVLSIYEPPQEGTDKVYRIQTDAGAAKLNTRAAMIARELGLVPVGMIFSHKMRNAVLSGYDIYNAAKLQVEFANELGEENANAFIILTVSPNEEGSTQFNSYQLSEQCLEMYRKGVFAPADQQRRNSGKLKTHPDGWELYKDKDRTFSHDKVLVENAEVDLVETEFFLINVAIQSHKGWVRTLFPVENREIAPQLIEDIGVMDLENSLSSILEIVREQRDPQTADETRIPIILELLSN